MPPCQLRFGATDRPLHPLHFVPFHRCRRSFVKANILQMVVVTNHQNGRDTHLRQIKVFGPRADLVAALGHPVSFTTPDFEMYATVR